MSKIISTFILTFFLSNITGQTKNQSIKVDSLKNWERKYFTQPLNNPFISYVIYGNFTAEFTISSEKYRTAGLPKGFDLMKYRPGKNLEVVKSFLEGYLWEDVKKNNSILSDEISNSKECFVLKGELSDTSNLNYLRDIVGVMTYLLDNGGVCVYDPQAFHFFGKTEWTEKIFTPNGSLPRNHVIILYSEEKGEKWYHTRGLRKFGRPDLSIHDVTPQYEDAVIELFNRFIEYEAFGGIIPDKQKVKMKDLPQGMWCENKGGFEDPDFNNKHIEIYWK